MVLVAVRENDGYDIVESILNRCEIGQDQINTRLGILGEEHPAVDDEDLPVAFENRHVATDLTKSTECVDANSSGNQWRWCR